MSSRLATMPRAEVAQLHAYEATIERGMATFIEVGSALAAIRDAKLYRADYPTFEEYCRERWGMSKTHANRLVASAEVAALVAPMGVIPPTERQVRPLTRLSPDEQPVAWERAQEIAADEGQPVRVLPRSGRCGECRERVFHELGAGVLAVDSPPGKGRGRLLGQVGVVAFRDRDGGMP